MKKGPGWVGRAATWFKARASVALALGVGVGIGIAVRYPTGWALPDNTASLFGSLIGAFATAAAVVLGFQLQTSQKEDERARNQADLRMRAKILLQPVLMDIGTAYENLVSEEQSLRDYACKILPAAVATGLERIRSRILMEELDNEGLVGLTYIETYMSALASHVRNVLAAMAAFDSVAGRLRLQTQRAYLASIANTLMDEIFEFAGGDSMDEWKLEPPEREVAQ